MKIIYTSMDLHVKTNFNVTSYGVKRCAQQNPHYVGSEGEGIYS